MARIKMFNQAKHEDKITYGDRIVDGIVSVAITEIPYVELYYPSYITPKKRSKSIRVSIDKGKVDVDVFVKIHFTQSVTDMAFKIQEVVRHSVEAMTEYQIENVNVIVKGVLFDDILTEKITADKTSSKQDDAFASTDEANERDAVKDNDNNQENK